MLISKKESWRESKQSCSFMGNSFFITVAVMTWSSFSLGEKAVHPQDASDVIVRSLALGLPQPNLECNKRSHGHMKEKLPEVAQFIEIHVA